MPPSIEYRAGWIAAVALSLLIVLPLAGQQDSYDLLLTGGHVIDPANNVDDVRDVAIRNGRIARVAASIPAQAARRTVDMKGLYVVPGLVDIHSHVYGYSGALFPDDVALPAGTTTVADAGGPGWRNFEDYREKILRRAKTRVLTFINIVGLGMGGDEQDVEDMDPQATAKTILEYPDLIVGIKNAHFDRPGWVSVERAVEAGRLSNRPVMLDNNILSWMGRDTRTKLLEKMRPGDLHTHFYNDRHIELLDRKTGQIQPFMREARQRGVLFDLGHGAGSFLWPVADRAMKLGFPPDTISTDIHSASILGTQSDMPNCMSKMLTLGMELKEIIYRSTVTPARAVNHFPQIGTLGEGRDADIAVLALEDGVFAYLDAWEMKRLATRRIANVLTVRAGEIVYDRDGRAFSGSDTVSDLGSDPVSDPGSDPATRYPTRGPTRGPTPRSDAVSDPGSDTVSDPGGRTPAQIYDLLLQNGHVIDPSTGRNGRYDIAIVGERIARIAVNLPARQAKATVDASAYIVTPGLIDLHAYVNSQAVYRQGDPTTSWRNVNPDHNALRHGVTTVVDGGSTGWKSFESFKRLVVDRSRVRVLAFLNIVSGGMLEGQAAADRSDLQVDKTVETARHHLDTIVGVRSPHLRGAGLDGVERSIRAAELMGGVALVEYLDQDGFEYRAALDRVRPGDLITHTFGLTTPVLDPKGNLSPAFIDARKRGVLFDLGHGTRGFWFRNAVPAARKGFLPDVLSTGMDKTSLLLPRADMMTTLSKFLNMGVTIEDLVERVTVRAARAIKRPELATLREGGLADIAVIEMETGRFGFLDDGESRLQGNRRLRAVLTIRNGQVAWDSEGLTRTDWSKAGPYTNYR